MTGKTIKLEGMAMEALEPTLDQLLSAVCELLDGSGDGDRIVKRMTWAAGPDGPTLDVEYDEL